MKTFIAAEIEPPISILHLEEESPTTAMLTDLFAQGKMPCTIATARSPAEYAAALERGGIDLIIANIGASLTGGLPALKLAQSSHPDCPFIFIAELAEEEPAMESLRHGAVDYVLKENLGRLVPAARRAVREMRERAVCTRLSEQFIQSQKMDVVGQLASGIAHDFNNSLSIILGYSEMIKQSHSSGDKTYQQAEKIRSVAEQAVTLTRQLLTFSRPEDAEPLVLDLNEVLRGTEQILHRLIRENIVVTTHYGDDLGSIKADAGSIGQILMNLVVNARDAMPQGGSLTMSTRNVTLTESRPGLEMAPGDYVLLEVGDTGAGMTPEIKAQLFEPFFTTKTKEKGTGLGLSICLTLVKAAGGYIEVESEVGLGATFKLYFPRVARPALSPPPGVVDQAMPMGTETLLVVEDEADVRHLAVAVLEAQGYTVLRSPNGQDALRLVRQHRGDPIKLVVSDVIMPQMDGKVMAEWLKTIEPGLRVLFTSGYNDDAISKHGVLEPGVAYLAKPYTSSTLTRKVRAVLDAPIGEA